MAKAKQEKISTLLYSGGVIHDWKGCGRALHKALKGVKELQVTQVRDDLDCLKRAAIKKHDLIVFYHTGTELTQPQKNGLLDWVNAGGGFVGIHSAADSFQQCPEYRAMVGGYFVTHPAYRKYMVSVVDSEHPITQGIDEFFVEDEQYVTDYDLRNNVLATALYRGKATPVVWTKSWGKGKVCWIALGHDEKACEHEVFVTLLERACLWASGDDASE